MSKNLKLVLFMQFFIFLGCKNRLFEKNRNNSTNSSYQGTNTSIGSPGFNHEDGLIAFYHERVIEFFDRINLCGGAGDKNCPFKNPEAKMLRLIDPQNSENVIEGYTWKNFLLNKAPDKVVQKLRCFNSDFNLTAYLDHNKNNLMEPPGNEALKPADCYTSWDNYNSWSFWNSNKYMEIRNKGFVGMKNFGIYKSPGHARDLLTYPVVKVDFPNYEYMKSIQNHKEGKIESFFGIETNTDLDDNYGPLGLVKHHITGVEAGDGGMSSNYYVVIHKEKFTNDELQSKSDNSPEEIKLAAQHLTPLYKRYVLMPLETAFKKGFRDLPNVGPFPYWAKKLKTHNKPSFMNLVNGVEKDAYKYSTDINQCNTGLCIRTLGRTRVKEWCEEKNKKCRIQTVKIESNLEDRLWRCEQNWRFMDLHTVKHADVHDGNGGNIHNIFHIVTDIEATDKEFPVLNHHEHPLPPRNEVVYIYHEQNLAFLRLQDGRIRCNIKETKTNDQKETRFIKERVGDSRREFRFKNMANNKYIHAYETGDLKTYHHMWGNSDIQSKHIIHHVGNHTDWTQDIVSISYNHLVKFLGYGSDEKETTFKHNATNYTIKKEHNISFNHVSNLVVNTTEDGQSVDQTSPVLIEDECYLQPDFNYKIGSKTLKEIFDLESDSDFQTYINSNSNNIDVKKIFKLNCDTRPDGAAEYIAQEDFTSWSDVAKRQLAAQIGIRFAENIVMFETGSYLAEKLFADWIVGVAKAMIFIDSLKMIPNFFNDVADYRMCVQNNTTETPCFAKLEESVLNMAFMAVAYHKAKSARNVSEVILKKESQNELLKFTNDVISEEKNFGNSNRMKETFNRFTIKGMKDKIKSFFESTNCKVN